MTTYNLVIADEYQDSNGEVKSFYQAVGRASTNKSGEGFNLFIPKGVTLSGHVLMLPKKKADKDNG